MARKKSHLIIPIFIPFAGCPNRCAFCDQAGITGSKSLPGLDEVTSIIESYLSTWRGEGPREIAFYGGSFTGLEKEAQIRYLRAGFGYVATGRVDGLRVSTRPDYITGEILSRLGDFGVRTVELGVQSMSDEVLRLSGRGHGAEETVKATGAIKAFGMKAGHQFMPGLPGDTADTVLETVNEIVRLSPDFVRIYPALVLKGTPLHRMYIDGRYSPWDLGSMVEVCKKASLLLNKAGIPVVRMGLQPTRELMENIVAGPFHPSFRQLVENRAAAL